jgi:hypothetical protein
MNANHWHNSSYEGYCAAIAEELKSRNLDWDTITLRALGSGVDGFRYKWLHQHHDGGISPRYAADVLTGLAKANSESEGAAPAALPYRETQLGWVGAQIVARAVEMLNEQDAEDNFGAWVKALKARLLELGIREHSMGLCVCYGYYYCADGGQAGVDAMLREWYAVGWTVETAAREIIHRHDLLHPERDENFGTEARAMRFLTWSVEVAVAMDRLGYVPGTGARAIPNREKRIGWYMAAYDMEWTPLRAAQTLHQLDKGDSDSENIGEDIELDYDITGALARSERDAKIARASDQGYNVDWIASTGEWYWTLDGETVGRGLKTIRDAWDAVFADMDTDAPTDPEIAECEAAGEALAAEVDRIDWRALDDDGDEQVREKFGCPACGNRKMERLTWADDETVRCDVCGVEYDPSKG